jgi:ASC-1-like (ASCH) protein
MNKLAIIAAAAFCVSSAHAAELKDLSISEIKASKIELPAPSVTAPVSAKCGHVSGEITKLNLLAQANKSQLTTYAVTAGEFKEFTDMWTPILNKFGMKVTGTEYQNELGILKYESADGRVVRTFLAEGMNYDALNVPAMEKLKHELLEPLEQAGMTPIAAFNIKNDIFRPTFNIYYLTKPVENADHESQLRQLKNGDDIDFDLLTNAVTLVKKDASFSMVYIGKLLGFKSKVAADEAGINLKLAEYKKFLAENKLEFIASRTDKIIPAMVVGEHTYGYFVNMYFFQ